MEKKYNDEELNKRVLEKLQKKIAISEYMEENHEKSNNNNFKKIYNFTIAKVASIVAILGLVSGNVYTYATYNQNMFSVILNKIGIFEEYNEEKTNVNITEKYDGISLTLTDYGIDQNTLIVGYSLKLDEAQDFSKEIFDDTKITSSSGTIELASSEEYSGIQMFDKISDTEYTIYKFYTLDTNELVGDINFVSEVTIWKDIYDPEGDALGTWTFDINLNVNDIELEYEKYEIEDKIVYYEDEPAEILDGDGQFIPYIQLLQVSKSNLLTKFTFFLNGYTDVNYYVEILGEDGNVILENNIEALSSGNSVDIVFKKIDFDQKVTINFYETDSEEEVISVKTMELDLSTELVK